LGAVDLWCQAAGAGAQLARGVGAVALVPWAMVWAGEAALELGQEAAAETTFAEAVACCRRQSDVYKWAEALVLTDLLELDPSAHDVELARALQLATTGPMPDLFGRLQHRSRRQTRPQTGDR
jgi:hypothetical protein